MRTVSLPAVTLPAIKAHLDVHVTEAPHSFVFTTEGGKTIWRGNFNKLVSWRAGRRRHQGAGTALSQSPAYRKHARGSSQTSTSLRDLMARMGHDSPRAALIYQHATAQADRAVAALDDVLRAHGGLGEPKEPGGRGHDDGDD